MTTELLHLVLISSVTAVMHLPYVANRTLMGPGPVYEAGYPEKETVLSPWAARLKKAHANAVENLVLFAPLVLVAHVMGVHNTATEVAAITYFWARIAHPVAYTFAVPFLRTAAFSTGTACQLTFAAAVLMA